MMINGMISAQPPSSAAARTSFQLLRGRGSSLSLRITHAQASRMLIPIIRPGTMPAMNSLVIDTCATTPNMTKAMLGGITGAMIPPAAIKPAERATL